MKTFRRIAAIILIILAVAVFSTACGGYTSDEACWLCGTTTEKTKAFKDSSGEKQYYCEDCSSECWICGEKATKYYTNLFEGLTFVCDDCYDELVEEGLAD